MNQIVNMFVSNSKKNAMSTQAAPKDRASASYGTDLDALALQPLMSFKSDMHGRLAGKAAQQKKDKLYV